MRDANPTLVAFLASRRPFFVADLFTFELANGTVYTWTSFDQNLRAGPYVYSSMGPQLSRTKWGIKNTVDVPSMEIRIFSTGFDLPDGTNLKLLAHNGLFDYSTITLSRLFMPTLGDTSLGPVDIFTGNAAEIKIDALSITLTVKGANVMLAQYMPRNMYTLSCIHTLYDEGCAPNPGQPGGGPARSAYTVENQVGADPSVSVIPWGGTVPATPGNFTNGYIVFTSGAANAQRRTIKLGSSSGLQLVYPLYETPAEGDTFTVTYGCLRNRGPGGCSFFNNLQHYRGFPYVPPETYGF
jgi:hypothetical protein